MSQVINGKVLAEMVYYPRVVSVTWFRTWSVKCGKCEKDFHRFAMFGEPKCPFCGTRNVLGFDWFY